MPGYRRPRGGGGFDRGPRPPHQSSSPSREGAEQAPEVLNFEKNIVWEDDPQFAERRERMLELAKKLKCERALQVMLAMMRYMENGTRPGNIYRGPTEEMIRAEGRHYRQLEHDEHVEQAWGNLHLNSYEKLNLPGLPINSDWARSLGVFKAAITPGEGINGVLDVIAPKNSEDKGDEHWQKFDRWCRDKRLSAYGLWVVAEHLKAQTNIKATDRDSLQAELNRFTPAQLDRIILAGYNQADDLRVLNKTPQGSGYKSLEGSLRDLDPVKKKAGEAAAWKAAEAARIKFMEPYAHPPQGAKGRWIAKEGVRRLPEWKQEEIWREADRVLDDTLEREMTNFHAADEPAVAPLQASAVSHHLPPAAIIARRGKINNKMVGFGVHPVSSEVVAAIVGDDRLHAYQSRAEFSSAHGGVVTRQDFALASGEGPTVKRTVEQASGEAAVKVFAHELAQIGSLTERNFSNDLPFMWQNIDLVAEGKMYQWHARSQGRLTSDFKLEDWYQRRLTDLGGITTVEAAKAHAKEFTATLADIFPGQESIVAEVEQNYPASIDIGGQQFPLWYRYVSKDAAERDLEVPGFSTKIEVQLHREDQKKALLSIPSATPIMVGSAANSLPIKFEVGNSQDATSDISKLQEILDHSNREKAWEKYPDKDKRWPHTIAFDDDIPPAGAAVIDTIAPYYTAQNGEPLYPTPAFMGSRESGNGFELIYGLCRTTKDAAETTKRRQDFHATDKARLERLRAITPEQRTTLNERAAILEKILSSFDVANPYTAKNGGHEPVEWLKRRLRAVPQYLESGAIDEANKICDRVETEIETNITKPWALWQEAVKLQEKLKGGQYRFAYKYDNYFDPERFKSTPHEKRQLPDAAKLGEILAEMNQAIASEDADKAKWKKWEAERRTEEDRLKSLSPEARVAEARQLRSEVEAILVRIRPELKKSVRRDPWQISRAQGEKRRNYQAPIETQLHLMRGTNRERLNDLQRDLGRIEENLKDAKDDIKRLREILDRAKSFKEEVERTIPQIT